MARVPNASRSRKFRVTLSEQSIDALAALSQRGIFGRNAAEVGGRFIDEALRQYVALSQIKLKPAKAKLQSIARRSARRS